MMALGLRFRSFEAARLAGTGDPGWDSAGSLVPASYIRFSKLSVAVKATDFTRPIAARRFDLMTSVGLAPCRDRDNGH